MNETKTTRQTSPTVLTPPASDFDVVYKFVIKRRAQPVEFRNLWQLLVKGPRDETFLEVVDADSLSTVLGKIGYVFEREGL
jgi:hypothetical protein